MFATPATEPGLDQGLVGAGFALLSALLLPFSFLKSLALGFWMAYSTG